MRYGRMISVIMHLLNCMSVEILCDLAMCVFCTLNLVFFFLDYFIACDCAILELIFAI